MFILAQLTNWSESDEEEEVVSREVEEEEEVVSREVEEEEEPAAVDQSESESDQSDQSESEDEGPRLEFIPPTPRIDPPGRLHGVMSSHPMKAYPKTPKKDYPQRPCRVCKKKMGRRIDTR